MRNNKIYNFFRVSTIILLLSLVTNIVVHYFENHVQKSVQHSIRDILEVKSILSLAQDAKKVQIAFFHQDKYIYLQIYNNAINNIYSKLYAFKKAKSDNVIRIITLLDKVNIDLKKYITLFPQKEIEESYVHSDLTIAPMESIIKEISKMLYEENKSLYQSQKTLDNLNSLSFLLKIILIITFAVFLYGLRRYYIYINSLEDRNLRLENIIEGITNGIIIVDKNGIIKSSNEPAQKIFDYLEDELIGKSIDLLIPKEYHTQHKKNIASYVYHGCKTMMTSGRFVSGVKKSGEKTLLEIGLSKIITANGSTQVIVTIVDATERNYLIENLSESNELNRAILDASSHLIISTDCQGIVTQFNSASEELLGYTAEEVVGKQTPALWHDKEEVAKRAEEISKELGENIPPGFEVFTIKPRNIEPERRQWTFIRKDKTTFPVQLTITCIRNENKKVIGYLGVAEDITQRKLSESLLAASEEKFRVMYENSPDGYLIMELDKARITDCNHMAEKMLNGTKEQILGLTPDQLSPEFQPDGRSSNERVQENIKIILKNGFYRFDWTHKKITGELFPCDVNISLINYEDRKVLLVGWRNMEKQKKAEKELQDSKSFLKLIFDNSPSILFVKDKEFRVVEANSLFLSMYPKSQQDKIIGYTTIESYNEDEAKEFLKNDKRAFDEGYSAVTETLITPDGTKRTLYTQKVRFEDGKNTPFILGISTDITEYEAELLLLQQMHNIISDINIDFTDRIQKILEEGCKYFQLPLGIISEISDSNYKLLYTSNNQILKPGEELYLEDMYSNITYEHNDTFYSENLRAPESSNNNSLKSSTYIGAKIIVNEIPFGTIIFSDVKKRKKKFSNREIAMLKHIAQWIGFEITKQNDVLEKNKLINKLSDSNEELERFAFVCSHDLQEPLRMIRSFSEKLQIHMGEYFNNDEKGKKYFHFITNGAEQAQDLIQDILTYSSIDNDTHPMEEVHPQELIDVIKNNLHLSLKERGGRITYDELPMLYGNKTQFFQLFQNLINNGIKYQELDSTPHVHVSIKDSGEYWQFAVKDNGIGIEKHHLTKIFDVFQRLNRKSQYPGTGIGLSICKKVVQRHGGKIWVESKKNIGSTFYFTILKSN